MKLRRRTFLHLVAGAVALPAPSRITLAQTYPARPITIIVPFAAGGPSDTLARILAEGMRQRLGQSVVIENATGGNGSIGVGRALRAAADGYTLSFGSISSHVLNGALYPLGYDLLKDLEPVALLGSTPLVVVGRKAIPGDDLRGLITWLKSNPDKASAGTAGVGNITHVAGILFQERTGTRFQFVPYRGTAPAMQDLVAGLIDLTISSPIDFVPHLRSGRIRAYAVMGSSRLPVAPDIPTTDEVLAGLNASAWYALWAPKHAPSFAIAKLNVAIVGSLADVQLRARLAQLGFDVFARDQQTPEALRAYQKAEIEKWLMTGINMQHVPYRGTAPAIQDLLTNRVQIMFDSLPSSLEHIRAGRLRALAVTTATRSEALPETPTIAEFVPGYDASNWFGIGAPKATPAEIIERLNREINMGLANARLKARLADLGGTPLIGSPADFGTLMTEDIQKWAKVINIAGVKAE